MTSRPGAAAARRRAEPRPLLRGAPWQDGLVWTTLAAGTIAVIPGGLTRFVFAKLAVVALGTVAAFLRKPTGRLPRSVLLALLGALTVAVVAALSGSAPLVQVLGRGPRYEGPLTLALYALVAGAAARTWGPSAGPDAWRWLIRSLAAAAVAVGSVAVLESFGIRPLSSSLERPGSLLGNASDLASWGLLALGPLALVAWRTKDRWAVVGAVGAGLAVAASASRGGLIGLVVVAAGVLVFAGRGSRVQVAAATLVLLVLATFAFPVGARVRGTDAFAAASVSGRDLLWSETVSLIRDHPLLGVGPGGFADAITAYRDDTWYRQVGVDNPPDSPHQIVLQVGAAAGLVGLVAAAFLLVAVVQSLRRRLRGIPVLETTGGSDEALVVRGFVVGLVGLAVTLSVSFTAPGTSLLAAVALGASVARIASTRRRRALELAAATAAGLAAATALTSAVAEVALLDAIDSLQSGDESGGQAAFVEAQSWRPWDVSVPTVAGHAFSVLASEGSTADAATSLAWLRPALERLPQSAGLETDQGSALESSGDLPGAQKAYARALTLDPHNPEIMLRLGVVTAQRGDLPAAERLLLAAAGNSPLSPDPWRDLAIVYGLMHEPVRQHDATSRADRLAQGSR